MDGGDMWRWRGSSMRRSSSSQWRSRNSGDVLSSTMCLSDEDDEEALKWAALERLPTYDRLRKGILTASRGPNEIDVHGLGIQDKRNLVHRLIDTDNAHQDNLNFLFNLKNRVSRVGIELPTIEVRFENLTIEADVYVGSRALPTFINFITNIFEGFFNRLRILPNKKKHITILNDVSGIIKPNRMTLVLGPPSSGKTTLLLALSGKLDKILKAVVAEGQKENVVTEYILKVLGLEGCADTLVGNEMIRGVSGGQRKRVTVGEMLVGPATALFMDEISTGLDSSTTYQVVNSIRQSIHILNGTAVISLLQPPPETYNLFDDIILLSDGYIVYHGPREHVLEFFESMGFCCPGRKGVADFLQEVTSKKDQHQYWVRHHEQYSFITTQEFSQSYKSFHIRRKLAYELSTPFDRSNDHPAALTRNKYGVRKIVYLKACLSREFLLMKRSSFVYIFRICKLAIIAFITMTVFLRTNMDKDTIKPGGSIYTGALFFSAMMIMFNEFSEMSMTIAKLPVFYKHRDLLFFPAWAYTIPSWILKIPFNLIEVSVWVFTTYYVIGFDPNVGRLFKQYLLLVLLQQMASGLFKTLGALGRSMVVANTFGFFALLSLFALGGFVLSQPWWIWGYWSSPLMYAQNALVVNEFLGHSWSKIPLGQTKPLGVLILEGRGFFPNAYWYWIGVGALTGFMFMFNFLYAVALTFLNPFGKAQSIPNEDNEKERKNTSALEFTELGHPVQNRIMSQGDDVIEVPHERRRMVLPFEQHSMTFDNVWYSVDMPVEMKAQGVTEDKLNLLKGVSGAFRPGVLTALMGASGAGKTTLMDVLAGRKTGGYIEGDIRISGYPKKHKTFARISGYCEQTDIHSPHITVYESLLYSAWLRLSHEIDSKTRTALIEIPYIFMQVVIYGVLVYAMIGFEWSAAKFFWYLFFMFFTLLYFTYFGMMVVALTPNEHIAAIVSTAFYELWNLFSGFIIPKPRIPVWWRWYFYLNPVGWTMYGLMASQFGDLQSKVVDSNPPGQTVAEFIESYFDFKHDFVGGVAGLLIAFTLLVAFIFAIAVKTFNFNKR